jgi:hypothetical protein
MDARVNVHGGPVAQPAAVILQTAVHPYIPTAVLAHKAVRSEPVHRPGGGLGRVPTCSPRPSGVTPPAVLDEVVVRHPATTHGPFKGIPHWVCTGLCCP